MAPDCDAIGLVWYKSWRALETIAQEPWLRQPLLDDELLTFANRVRDSAMMTEEALLNEGAQLEDKLFLFGMPSIETEASLRRTTGVGRIVCSRAVRNGYTAASRPDYDAVYETWYPNAACSAQAVRDLRDRAGIATRYRILAARERSLYGPAADI